jgi:hypothetical protein
MITRTIVVTREIIDGSDGQDASNCMVYNAAKPLIPSLYHVGVLHGTCRKSGTLYYIGIPEDIQDKISQHFDGNNPEPFQFDWEVPDHLCD